MKKNTLVLDTTPEALAEGAEIIRRGGLVVFPTETVYGLGADAYNPEACAGIFRAKGRPQDNPLIVHFADPFSAAEAADVGRPEEALLMEAFMPGPLTLILAKRAVVPDEVTAGLPTVGVRVPRDPVAGEFLRLARVPVAAPSANVSGRPSPTTFEMAWEAMAGKADAVIRGGDCEVGLESTIVRVTEEGAEILRPGRITEEDLKRVLEDFPVFAGRGSGHGRPAAPGMKYTHYKPKAEVSLFLSPAAAVRELTLHPEERYGILCLEAVEVPRESRAAVRRLGSPEEYARRLYAEMFTFDKLGCGGILAEYPEDRGLGKALRNRLLKAAGGKFLPE